MHPSPNPIAPDISLGKVTLTVTDLARSLEYYTNHIGLRVLAQDGDIAWLGAGDDPLLELRACADARADSGASGLYHFALLVSSRQELARTLQHLLDTQTPIDGASDHAVSEALYLSDPDGHGIEIYRDRDQSDWYDENGNFLLTTMRLDVEGVMDELGEPEAWTGMDPQTVIGHVHLQVGNVAAAQDFYVNVIGLNHMADYPSATFLSAGGYHHHLGANQWQSAGRGQPAPTRARLLSYTICLPDQQSSDTLWERIHAAAAPVEEWEGTPVVLDPAGNRLRFVVRGSED